MAAQQNSAMAQNLILENRGRLSVTGVEEVTGFDESYIRMVTTLGELIVRGSGLRMEILSVETGEAVVAGRIDELAYEEPSRDTGLLARLFKTDGIRP